MDKRNAKGWLYLLPAIAFLGVFMVYPLVDVFVKGGNRQKDVNKAEAKAIVNEIANLIADPVFDGRSIGVVTLMGTEQASYIH